jgi:hypothetical protein
MGKRGMEEDGGRMGETGNGGRRRQNGGNGEWRKNGERNRRLNLMEEEWEVLVVEGWPYKLEVAVEYCWA